MENKFEDIYLNQYVVPGIRTLHNRFWGIKVRVESEIDRIEPQVEKITIHISPENAPSITSSFFEEFLRNVVTRLGKERFLEKIRIDNSTSYRVDRYVNQAVDKILTTRPEYAE